MANQFNCGCEMEFDVDGIISRILTDQKYDPLSTNAQSGIAIAQAIKDAITSSGVTSFNNRRGDVLPAAGDYTADMVGALSRDDVMSEYDENGTSPVNGKAVAVAVSTKADAANTINGINITGTTVTVTYGDGSTKTFITQDTNTTYSDATESVAGLMSASDKTKLDGIADGATNIVVDSDISATSTNPVQNKVISGALSDKANIDMVSALANTVATKADQTAVDAVAKTVNTNARAITDLADTAADTYATKMDVAALNDVVDGKADKATTVAGYGITDAATAADLKSLSDTVATKVDKNDLGSYATKTYVAEAIEGVTNGSY